MAAENQMQDESFADKQTAKAAIAYITGEIQDAELAERKVEVSAEKKELAKSYFSKYKARNSIVRNLSLLFTAYILFFILSNHVSVAEIVGLNFLLIGATALIFYFNEKEYVSELMGDRRDNKTVERVTYAVFGYVPLIDFIRIVIYEIFLNAIFVTFATSLKEFSNVIPFQTSSIALIIILVFINIVFMSMFKIIFIKNIK